MRSISLPFRMRRCHLCIPRFVQLVARQLRKPHITVRTRPSTKRLSKINRRRNHFNKLTRPACWCMPLCRLLTCQARLLLTLVRPQSVKPKPHTHTPQVQEWPTDCTIKDQQVRRRTQISSDRRGWNTRGPPSTTRALRTCWCVSRHPKRSTSRESGLRGRPRPTQPKLVALP
jgi:hypothetical protein